MRSFRQLAALGLVLVPLTLAGPVGPAHAGGSAGMTLTASLDHLSDPDPRFLVGTRHTVFVTVADDPGEASLRQIRVGVADLDPADFPVACDAGPNGSMSLELHQSLHCTADFSAELGERTILVSATAQVPGLGPQTRMQTLHYTGFMPPPPPPPPAPIPHAAVGIPPHHSAPLQPGGGHQADPLPSSKLPIMTPPLGPLPDGPNGGLVPGGQAPVVARAAGDPPVVGGPQPAADCPASGSAGAAGSGSASGGAAGPGCCSGTTSTTGAARTTTSTCCPHSGNARDAVAHQDESAGSTAACQPTRRSVQGLWGLPLTGTSAPLVGAAALAVVFGGAGLVRLGRVRARR